MAKLKIVDRKPVTETFYQCTNCPAGADEELLDILKSVGHISGVDLRCKCGGTWIPINDDRRDRPPPRRRRDETKLRN